MLFRSKRGEKLIRFPPLSRCITSFLTGLYCEKVCYYCFLKHVVVLPSLRHLCFIIVVTFIITEHSSERIIVHDIEDPHTLFIETVGIHYFVKSDGNCRAAREKQSVEIKFLPRWKNTDHTGDPRAHTWMMGLNPVVRVIYVCLVGRMVGIRHVLGCSYDC